MDINFPLILVLLVFITGVVWLIDKLWLAPRRKEANEPIVVEYSKSFFPVLFAVLILRSFIVEPFQIPSGSMIPTLEVGDFILVNKFTYGIRLPVIRNKVISINQPKRGDVMVFFPPHESRYFIKRVIGLPGDEIRYVNHQLFINGEAMPQTLLASLPPQQPSIQLTNENVDGVEHKMLKHVIPGPYSRNFSTTVPEGHYFMMGDNRDNSLDSRDWGTVPEENIVGKAFAIWMHWIPFNGLPEFSRLGSIQ